MTDDQSGAETPSVSQTADTASVGAKAVVLEARDLAGNLATQSCSYRVEYGFEGFVAPLENPPDVNVARAGRAVAVKWRLTDASGAHISDLGEAQLTAVGLVCDLGTTPDLERERTAGRSGLQSLGHGYYQLNWQVPSGYAGSCKELRLDLGEGAFRTARFRLL